jgi:hypothetical protein
MILLMIVVIVGMGVTLHALGELEEQKKEKENDK